MHDYVVVQDSTCGWRVQPRCRRHIPIPIRSCYTPVWGPLSHTPACSLSQMALMTTHSPAYGPAPRALASSHGTRCVTLLGETPAYSYYCTTYAAGSQPHTSHLAEVQEYWQYRDRLSAVDEVLMMDSHILVPPELRQDALAALHAAHQGVSSMQNRAQASVFWPGSSGDLDTVCRECAICNQITPSQTALSPAEPVTPSYTFQAIDANHFTVHGTKYLVIVDRFSEWPHIMRTTKSDEALGTQGLIRNLKLIFASCGAPDKLSSDGGPEFTADQTHAFLERWGVTHRLSSAYNPTSNGRASQHKGNFMVEFPLDSAAYLVRVRCLADV